MSVESDIHWMQKAIELAQQSAAMDEVPVGAVLVKESQIIGQGCNQPIATHDATAHAEIQAIREAGLHEQNYRHPNTTLYVTLEPCTMCAGAIIHARIERVVYGAKEPRTGAVESVDTIFDETHHNHKVIYQGGILETQCSELIKTFFRSKRQKTL